MRVPIVPKGGENMTEVEMRQTGSGEGREGNGGWLVAVLLIVVILVLVLVYYRPGSITKTTDQPTKQESAQPLNVNIDTNTTPKDTTTPPATEAPTQQPTP